MNSEAVADAYQGHSSLSQSEPARGSQLEAAVSAFNVIDENGFQLLPDEQCLIDDIVGGFSLSY